MNVKAQKKLEKRDEYDTLQENILALAYENYFGYRIQNMS